MNNLFRQGCLTVLIAVAGFSAATFVERRIGDKS